MAGIDVSRSLITLDPATPFSAWRIARYHLDAGVYEIHRRELRKVNTPMAGLYDRRSRGNGCVDVGHSQIDQTNRKTFDASTIHIVKLYRVPIRR